MNKKHLVKILKAELSILNDLINELPDNGEAHPIEVDITLSKVKDIYNELLLLKDGERAKVTAPGETEETTKTVKEESPVAEVLEEEEKANEIIAESEKTTLPDEDKLSQEVSEEEEAKPNETGLKIKSTKSTLKPQKKRLVNKEVPKDEEDLQSAEADSLETEPDTEGEQKHAAEPQEAKEEPETQVDEPSKPKSQNVETPDPEPEVSSKKEKPSEKIIADKFHNSSPSVNEMLASFKKDKDLASRLKDSPIADLKKAIKINDRIWFINELFNKDVRLYDETLTQLNSAANLDEALNIIFNNFNWDQNKKSTISFLELIYRRFAV